jgi:hypothetical protein
LGVGCWRCHLPAGTNGEIQIRNIAAIAGTIGHGVRSPDALKASVSLGPDPAQFAGILASSSQARLPLDTQRLDNAGIWWIVSFGECRGNGRLGEIARARRGLIEKAAEVIWRL